MSENTLMVAKRELKKYFIAHMTEREAEQTAEKAVVAIDWNNPALTHKDICWLAKNYMKVNGIA